MEEFKFTPSHPKARLFHLKLSKLLNDGEITREIYEEVIQLYKERFHLSQAEYDERAGLV